MGNQHSLAAARKPRRAKAGQATTSCFPLADTFSFSRTPSLGQETRTKAYSHPQPATCLSSSLESCRPCQLPTVRSKTNSPPILRRHQASLHTPSHRSAAPQLRPASLSPSARRLHLVRQLPSARHLRSGRRLSEDRRRHGLPQHCLQARPRKRMSSRGRRSYNVTHRQMHTRPAIL